MDLKTTLYTHQQAGVDKLLPIRVGALYMEMGTGKTRTTLEMIKRRLDAGKIDKVLWLCPCSVRNNLAVDLDYHCDGWRDVIRIGGIESISQSSRIYMQLLEYVRNGQIMLVVDESNLVKNHRALRTQRIMALARACRYRVILNGTPISRNEADLYAQWYILDWRILGYQSYWSFSANHLEFDEKTKRVRRVLNVSYLTEKIAPYAYQVLKSECLDLPDKRFDTDDFWLTDAQAKHYEEVKTLFLSAAIAQEEVYGSAAIYRAFTALQDVTSGRRIVSRPEDPIRHVPFFTDPMDNPRIQQLLRTLDAYAAQKTIIWCKFTHEILDIERVLHQVYPTLGVELFYGDLPYKKRLESLRRFQGDSRFLIANKMCAGYGLNLQFCHQAIYYDNDWSWATRAQSIDRLHRIGQTHQVDVVDLCALSKIDVRILRCIMRKENLVDQFKENIGQLNLMKWIDGEDETYDSHRAE